MEYRYLMALNQIKDIVDAYKEGRFRVTVGNDDFDKETHTYDVSAVMGIIGNHIVEAFRDAEDWYEKGLAGERR